MDYKRFFSRNAEEVAKDLLGRLLVRTSEKGTTAGMITETGAYEGGSETRQRQGMKYAAGEIFLMPFRGHYFFNIATGKKDYPSCVEIRELDFYDRKVQGSGAIVNALCISKNLDGKMLGEELQILGLSPEKIKIKRIKGKGDNCLGYFFAQKMNVRG